MKGLDVLIVRLLPFVVFFVFGFYVICAIKDIYVSDMCCLHGNSCIYALGLYLISLSNRKYHCTYNRAMYIFLILVPIFNYVCVKFDVFDNKETYLNFIRLAFIITSIITAYLAVKHFIQQSKKRITHTK